MMAMSYKDGKGVMDNRKYVCYTPEQVEALECVFHECPKPSSICCQQLIREYSVLSNIDPRQIKVCFKIKREKQRKEASRLQAVNRKLTAMNKFLIEENDRLQKQVSHLVCENGYFHQHTQNPGPKSIGIVAISHSCTSLAAQACGLVGLKPTKVVEILKDRPSWFHDCRVVNVLNVLPTANGICANDFGAGL